MRLLIKVADTSDGHFAARAGGRDGGKGEGEAFEVFGGTIGRLGIILDGDQQRAHGPPGNRR